MFYSQRACFESILPVLKIASGIGLPIETMAILNENPLPGLPKRDLAGIRATSLHESRLKRPTKHHRAGLVCALGSVCLPQLR